MSGINVYEIQPGVIETDMTGAVKEKYDKLFADGLTPINRWGLPSDVGKCVAAIALGHFPYTTGQVFEVDGGFTSPALTPFFNIAPQMIKIRSDLKPSDLTKKIARLWEAFRAENPVHQPGRPARRSRARLHLRWQIHRARLDRVDAGFRVRLGDLAIRRHGRRGVPETTAANRPFERMAHHITHVGVHDHGFNNVCTYGNLWRLMDEGRIPETRGSDRLLRTRAQTHRRGAGRPLDGHRRRRRVHLFVQRAALALCRHDPLAAARWRFRTGSGTSSWARRDLKISLLGRLIEHARATAKYNVYYGEGRDYYDVRGRVAHESVFNMNNGDYRCPNSQQGYAPFSTWTRGLAWIMCGYPEELELLATLPDEELAPFGGRADIEAMMLKAARATCDFYLNTRRPTASRTGTPARRNCSGSAIISTAPPIPSTTTSRWTAAPPPSPRRVCCGSGTISRHRVTRRRARVIARPD